MLKSNALILESNNIRTCLICVGSELLRGKVNTHSSLVARRLASVGLALHDDHTVGDDRRQIAQTIRRALHEHDVVIVTGGLGPTFDDLTREGASDAMGRPLVLSRRLLRTIAAKFRLARHRRMPPANERQAFVLEGAKPLANSAGTAPGQWLDLREVRDEGQETSRNKSASSLFSRPSTLVLLPGPPAELTPMLDRFVIPSLRRRYATPPRAEAHLHFVGLPESVVDHRIRPLLEKIQGAEFTILAHLGLVDFDIFISAPSRKQANARIQRVVGAVRARFGRAFYGMNEDFPLEKVVMDRFLAHKATLAVAESCTGGMLAKRLTDIAGSSRYFAGGVVAYSNHVKRQALGVPPTTLVTHGAVSKEIAAAMAQGVRRRLGATWGLSITGIAGPGGGTAKKPVGLVYVGLAGPRGVRVRELHLRGSRNAIRTRSVVAALDLLRLIYL